MRTGESSLTPLDGISEVNIVRFVDFSDINGICGFFVINANFDNFLKKSLLRMIIPKSGGLLLILCCKEC